MFTYQHSMFGVCKKHHVFSNKKHSKLGFQRVLAPSGVTFLILVRKIRPLQDIFPNEFSKSTFYVLILPYIVAKWMHNSHQLEACSLKICQRSWIDIRLLATELPWIATATPVHVEDQASNMSSSIQNSNWAPAPWLWPQHVFPPRWPEFQLDFWAEIIHRPKPCFWLRTNPPKCCSNDSTFKCGQNYFCKSLTWEIGWPLQIHVVEKGNASIHAKNHKQLTCKCKCLRLCFGPTVSEAHILSQK